MRLDQALGAQAEPVAAEPDAPHFGVRMTLPEPIGLQSDVMAGLARLLDRLCAKLATTHMGARRLRLELRRVDRAAAQVDIGLARPMRDPVYFVQSMTSKRSIPACLITSSLELQHRTRGTGGRPGCHETKRE